MILSPEEMFELRVSRSMEGIYSAGISGGRWNHISRSFSGPSKNPTSSTEKQLIWVFASGTLALGSWAIMNSGYDNIKYL